MTVTVELHGRLADGAPSRSWSLDIPGQSCRVEDAVRAACAVVPGLGGGLDGIAFAVGDRLVSRSAEIVHGDVLSLLPPVSGG